MAITDVIRKLFRPRAGKHPRLLLINDTSNVRNYGLQATMDALRHIFGETLPGHQLDTIPNHWIIDAAFGFSNYYQADEKPLTQPQAAWPIIADEFEPMAEEWLQGRGGAGAATYLDKLEKADLIVLNGENNIYRQNLSATRALFLLWLGKTHFRKPAYYFNGTIHLTHTVPVLPAMVRKTFTLLDGVAVREPYSLRNLQEFVPGLAARMIPDAVFRLEHPRHERAAIERIAPAIKGGDYFCFGPGAMPTDHRFGQRSAIYRLIEALKAVGPQAVLVAKDSADVYLETVAKETGSVYFSPERSYQELLILLEHAKFQVSGRYHLMCMATSINCPSVPLAGTSHKNQGLCELLEGNLGMPHDVTDLRSQVPAIVERARHFVEQQSEVRTRLQALSARFRADTAALGTMLVPAEEAQAAHA